MRILFITSTPPIPTWGGAMAFYRHLCERKDFEVSVITDNPQVLEHRLPYKYSLISRGNLWERLSRSRLSKTVHTWSHLVGVQHISSSVLREADKFGADVVLTVAGSWSWTSILASHVAQKLKLPLVGSFNDWWYYNSIRHKALDGILEANFKNFYRKCDLALCTSEGMRQELGHHDNAVILYPIGSTYDNAPRAAIVKESNNFNVAFGGNLGEWYGHMLEALITTTKTSPKNVEFSLFGSNASWTDEFDKYVKAQNIFHGQVPFFQLRSHLSSADALLLLMGFDDNCAQIERTSFKTKFLDYLSFQKPILLWGPEYCSAVRIAREFDSAEICTSPNVKDFLDTIMSLKANKDRQLELTSNAQQMYKDRFHPDKIHSVFVTSLKSLSSKQVK